MLRLLAAGFLTASITVVGAGANAAGPYRPPIQVGDWTGGAYTNDATGEFTHCGAVAHLMNYSQPSSGGIYFGVAVTASGGWGLGFVDPVWQLNQFVGQTIPVDLTFDDQRQFHVFAVPRSGQMVEVPMPNNSELLHEFRTSGQMQAFALGQMLVFNLSDISQLMSTLVECVNEWTGQSPAAEPPPVANAEPPPVTNTEPSSAPTTERASSPALQIEAMEDATNFILQAKLHNAHVIGSSEMPAQLATDGVAAWKADEGYGTVKIIPDKTLKGLDVATDVAAADSEACGGKFASGRVSELVDSDVEFRGFASCDDSNGTIFTQHFIVPRSAGGFVIFTLSAAGKASQPPSVTDDENLVTLRQAALVSTEDKKTPLSSIQIPSPPLSPSQTTAPATGATPTAPHITIERVRPAPTTTGPPEKSPAASTADSSAPPSTPPGSTGNEEEWWNKR